MKSSWRAFKDAFNFCLNALEPIAWLVVGQFVLIGVIFFFLTLSPDPQATIVRYLVVILLFLYQLLLTLSLIGLLVEPKQDSVWELLKSYGVPKLVQAIVLTFVVAFMVALGGILLVIPGIILYVYFFLSIYALVTEKQSMIQSLKRSFVLVRGHWWTIFGRTIFASGIIVLISFFAIVPFYGLILSSILTILLAPIFVIYFGQTYQDLVAVKSGLIQSSVSLPAKLILVLWAIVVFSLLTFLSLAADFVVRVTAGII